MPDNIASLETSRASLLRRFAQLLDMRPGSVGAVFRRCLLYTSPSPRD